MIDETPEPSLIPPDPPPELEWTDWSAPAFVSVSARTAEEAKERIGVVLADVNLSLRALGAERKYGAIIELASDRLPEPS